jgi:glycolate oxidase iron-sulfur subunit
MGKTRDSHAAAGRNIRAWMNEVNGAGLDAIVINTSGCGTVVKDYGFMFRNDALADDAATIAMLAKDISEVLADIELDYKMTPDLRVAYHATCSLQFGQRIRFTPKKMLKAAGFTLIEPRDSHTCCGFAGTYRLHDADRFWYRGAGGPHGGIAGLGDRRAIAPCPGRYGQGSHCSSVIVRSL